MAKYEFVHERWLRGVARAHRVKARPAQHSLTADNLEACATEIERLRDEVKHAASSLRATAADHAALRAVLSEARDFIMSGPRPGDEVAIVNKISAALGDKA